jgi:hypothetical protein
MRYGYLRLILLLMSWNISDVQAQRTNMPAIYYRMDDALYRIVDGQMNPEIAVSNMPITFYSNNARWGAYWDERGVWIGELDSWNPQLVIEDTRGLKWGGLWTPDDNRFIIRIADSVSADGTADNADTMAYNMLNRQAEAWPWGTCNRVGREILSKRVALICSADSWEQNADPATVALFWGGEFIPYDTDAFETLVDNFANWQPVLPFDWRPTESGDSFVYIADNPDFSWDNLDSDEPLRDIFWIEDTNPIRSINSSRDIAIETILAVSPDRTMVAYEINCNYFGPRACLIVVNLDTGQVVQNFKDRFFVHFASDIAWYLDNQRVALVGNYNSHPDTESGTHIWVADITTGKVIDYDIGNSLGGVCCIAINNMEQSVEKTTTPF